MESLLVRIGIGISITFAILAAAFFASDMLRFRKFRKTMKAGMRVMAFDDKFNEINGVIKDVKEKHVLISEAGGTVRLVPRSSCFPV